MNNRPIRLIVMIVAILCTFVLAIPSAVADGGGTLPSEAPSVTLNTTYYGDNSHCDDTNCHKDFWRLPALLNRDNVQVAWRDDSGAGVQLCLTGNVDDYSWSQHLCNLSDQEFQDFGSGQRDVFVTTKAASAAYLVTDNNNDYGPYHFVVEAIRHQISLNVIAPSVVHAKTTMRATAALTNGAAVPDGLTFVLQINWPSHSLTRTSKSKGGKLSFALNLPRSAVGRKVSFEAVRAVSNTYVRAASTRFTRKIS